jgi:hypothetical protein
VDGMKQVLSSAGGGVLDSSAGEVSSAQRVVPRMNQRTLSILLGLMALVPPVVILALWNILPPLSEGTLAANATGRFLPDPGIYELPFGERPEIRGGQLVIRNTGLEDWTNINIWVNGHYQISDRVPLPAGQEREYLLELFVTRWGANYELGYNRLAKALIYARLPKGNRATRAFEFDATGTGTPFKDR